MADNEEKIELFCSLTNAPRHVADHYLGAHDWNLDRSISYYFDNPPNDQPAPASPVAERADTAEEALPVLQPAPQPAAQPVPDTAAAMDEDEEFQMALAASLAESGPGDEAAAPVSHPTRVELMDEDEDLSSIGRRPVIPPSIWPDGPGGFPSSTEPLMPRNTHSSRRTSAADSADLAVQGRGVRSRPSSRTPSFGPSSHPAGGLGTQRSRITFDDDFDNDDDVHVVRTSEAAAGPRENGNDVEGLEAGSSIELPEGIDVEEARMLEAAMLGIPYEGAALQRTLQASALNAAPLSPGAEYRQQLRYEQDQAYEMSLAADRAKAEAAERAKREAEEAERQQLEAERREREAKEEEEKQLKKSLSMKQLRLPDEPDADSEDSIVIMVRVPDGTRPSRRFSKNDPLHAVFDFIDLHYQGQTIKPGSYRLVTQFPRKVFTPETPGTFAESGLTSRQEALLLEQST